MKSLHQFLIVVFTVSATFIACEKEDAASQLSISDIKVENHDGGTSIPLGGVISVNFTATAGDDARLDFYHIEIHDHPASGLVVDEYKIIDDSFKEQATFKGLRNAHVHEDVVVPDTANLGAYHVVIVVVDEDGNSVDTEGLETSITIVE